MGLNVVCCRCSMLYSLVGCFGSIMNWPIVARSKLLFSLCCTSFTYIHTTDIESLWLVSGIKQATNISDHSACLPPSSKIII
jgi:hypothetical protein